MVLCVTATDDHATDATKRVRLRLDVFDLYAARLGATTDAARAKLIDVDRITMWRYRKGHLTPSLSRAMGIAEKLGIDLEVLIDRDAA